MMHRYGWFDVREVTDKEIIEQFAIANSLSFSARRFNYVEYRFVAFGDIHWWLPLIRVLPLVGVTPQMLRPVFSPQWKMVKRHFPFNLSWFGLNKNLYKRVKVELPSTIETYEQLGNFPLSGEPFQQLARVLQKSVKVFRQDGGTGEHWLLFTVHPSGEITEAAKM